MISPSIPSVVRLRESFLSAKPFKYLCIDNFLIPSLADRLAREYAKAGPSQGDRKSIDSVEKKAREGVRSIGTAFSEVDDLLSSAKFLHFLSEVTAIPDIRYDAEYFDTGAFQRTHGEAVDTHIDGNFHPSTRLHRRLNLFIFLSKEWSSDWGGEVVFHSNPRKPQEDRSTSFEPLFNRCLIFETTEHSWHSVSKITLPSHKRDLCQRSLALSFYSETRPPEELAPRHGAFYVPRPLPSEIASGVTLTDDQAATIKDLIQQRDESIGFYQKLELSMSAELDRVTGWAEELRSLQRVNTLGYITQTGPVSAYHSDRWIENGFSAQFIPLMPITSLEIVLTAAAAAPVGQKVEIIINDDVVQRGALVPGHPAIFSITHALPAQEPFQIVIRGDPFCPAALGISPDIRNLIANLERVVAHHK